MSAVLLPDGSRVSEVTLTVADLERAAGFYERTLGLGVVGRAEGRLELGAGGSTIVRLVHDPDARPPKGAARLYHFAILYPSRRDLAHAVLRLEEAGWPVEGASDHLVSEAIYLADPEGNGIELYRDRPRREWPVSDGRIQMATLPLDVQQLLAEAGGPAGEGAPAGTRLGHIHLHVSDLEEAERFYRDVVGFALTTRYGDSASFLAAGGYHHHVGINIWGTRGAPPALEGALGLRWYDLSLPTPAGLAELKKRLRAAGVPYEEEEGALRFRDPSGHQLAVYVGAVVSEDNE